MKFTLTEEEDIEIRNTIKSADARRLIRACLRKNKIKVFGKKTKKVFQKIRKKAFIKKYSTTLNDDLFEDFLEKLEDIGTCDEEILKFRRVRKHLELLTTM